MSLSELELTEENIKKAGFIKTLKIAIANDWCDSMCKIVPMIKERKLNKQHTQYLLSFWHDKKDNDVVFLNIIKKFLFDKETMEYLFNQLELSDKTDMLQKLIQMPNNQNFHIIATSLLSYYDEDLNPAECMALEDYTREFQADLMYDCTNILDFIMSKKSQLIYAPVPDWVSVKEGENLSLLKIVPPGKSHEDIELSMEKMLKKSKDIFHGIELDPKLEEAFLIYLSSASLEENESTSYSANRVFGPANRFMDKNCISNPYKNGPCRMLECLCKEQEEDLDPEYYTYNEWFHGKCQRCFRAIRDRSHAIRIPIENGGWYGCFCTFDCMKDDIPVKDQNMNLRIEMMKNALEEDGIMDRTKT